MIFVGQTAAAISITARFAQQKASIMELKWRHGWWIIGIRCHGAHLLAHFAMLLQLPLKVNPPHSPHLTSLTIIVFRGSFKSIYENKNWFFKIIIWIYKLKIAFLSFSKSEYMDNNAWREGLQYNILSSNALYWRGNCKSLIEMRVDMNTLASATPLAARKCGFEPLP